MRLSSNVIKRFQTHSPLIKWAVCLLFIQMALPGLVLCFGINNHFAVEKSHAPSHAPQTQSQQPCLDVPLISVRLTETSFGMTSGLFWQYPGFTPAALSTPLSPLATVLSLAASLQSQPSAYSSLPAFRTVVLLI